MSDTHFTLFDTAIGACGIAWGVRGIVGLQLPESSEDKARARLKRRFPQAAETPPPATIRHAIDLILRHLRGELSDLSAIALDLEALPAFDRKVYEVARTITTGATLTYGEIATRLGDKLLSRDVGQALGRNPFPIVVPCHRVVAAGGKLGGFSARGGTNTKLRLLAIEGAALGGQPGLFDRSGDTAA
jgi:methylated-DNA-[protein]-cysteine S-methyltransferase